MTERTKWSVYYLLTMCLEVVIFAASVHAKAVAQGLSSPMVLIGSAVLSAVILVPFYIVTWTGFSKRGRFIQRAIGTGFLLWILIIDVHLLISLFLGISSDTIFLIYAFDVAIGLALIWYFSLPYESGILAVIFPGVSLLYFLIYGQVRSRTLKD